MMFREIAHIIGAETPNDPIGLLVAISMVRDDMPWLYELGMEAYRLAKAGSGRSSHRRTPIPTSCGIA